MLRSQCGVPVVGVFVAAVSAVFVVAVGELNSLLSTRPNKLNAL